MEKEHTPAKTTPGRTAFRFTRQEIIQALAEYVVNWCHGPVPEGAMSVVLPLSAADSWAASLIVNHPDPPPTRKDADDE